MVENPKSLFKCKMQCLLRMATQLEKRARESIETLITSTFAACNISRVTHGNTCVHVTLSETLFKQALMQSLSQKHTCRAGMHQIGPHLAILVPLATTLGYKGMPFTISKQYQMKAFFHMNSSPPLSRLGLATQAVAICVYTALW